MSYAFFLVPVGSGVISRLVGTHPPRESRLERLRDLDRAAEAGRIA